MPPKVPPSRFEQLNQAEPPRNPFIAERQEFERRKKNRKQGSDRGRHARKMVARALETGYLVRKPCEYGFTGCQSWPVEAHHTSYKPGDELLVKWACKPCHDRLTREAILARNRWPKRVIHLIGTQCAGKSSLFAMAGIEKKQRWDVLSFYARKGVWRPGEGFPPKMRVVNPGKWYAITSKMIGDLSEYLQDGREIAFVESSGINRKINDFFKRCETEESFKANEICLEVPTEAELRRRAEARNIEPKEVLHFARVWAIKQRDKAKISQDEALQILVRECNAIPV